MDFLKALKIEVINKGVSTGIQWINSTGETIDSFSPVDGKLIAEAILNKFTSLGGFDITRNNMPFPSNRMNATTVGANFKIELTKNNNLAFEGGGNTTIAGRNVGQSTLFYGSIFYIIDFTRSKK